MIIVNNRSLNIEMLVIVSVFITHLKKMTTY